MEENNVNDILGIENSQSQSINESNSAESSQQDSPKNKIVNVKLTGGIIGLLSDSPQNSLNRKIRKENANGWRIVQIIPAASGNIFLYIIRFLILILTLFLYQPTNGFYVIMEKTHKDNQISKDSSVVKDLKCSKCGKEFSSNLKGTFCEECGNKL